MSDSTYVDVCDENTNGDRNQMIMEIVLDFLYSSYKCSQARNRIENDYEV